MRRNLIAMGCLAILLLTGCGNKAASEVTSTATSTPEITQVPTQVPTQTPEAITTNPYFPYGEEVTIPVNMVLEVMIDTEASMKMKCIEQSEEGWLYSLSFNELRNTDTSDYEGGNISSAQVESMYSDMGLLEWGDMWVTKDKIYYIWYWDKGDKKRLLNNGTIPEGAFLVCQEGKLKDKLKEGEAGEHRWIEKHGDDIRCFRTYTEKEDHNDAINIFQFVWKKEVGLIGCKCMGHAAGGNSVFAWQNNYLKYEDMDFNIEE